MFTKNAASPSKQKIIDRKRPGNFTPPSSKKQKPKDKNKEVETKAEDICAVCDEPILEWSETCEGEEAIFCEGSCNAWIHRKCSGLSSKLFDILSNDSKEPFRCCYCTLPHQRDEINILKNRVESLTAKISSLQSCNSVEIKTTSETLNSNEINHSNITSETSSSKINHLCTSSDHVEPPKAKSDKLFNVVVYGIKESQPKSSRATRQKHDIDAIQNVLTHIDPTLSKSSISDFHRLGKCSASNSKSRPILIKFLRTLDATLILSKRASLPKQIVIKSDMTREERAVEAVYLRTRWNLAQNGTDKKFIKLRGKDIYVNKSLFGTIERSDSTKSYVMTPITSNHPGIVTTDDP